MGIFVAFALFFGAVVALALWSAAKRRKALAAVAQGLGWSFAEKAPDHAAAFHGVPLFEQGRSRTTTNLLRGTFGGRAVEVFDYAYTSGSGKNRTTHHQTVVHFDEPALRLPAFSVRPEGAVMKLFAAFGYQDIDLPARPEFSKRFVLRGPDETAIRRRFDDPLPDVFDANRGVCVDGVGTHLFVFQAGRLTKPDALPDALTRAAEILRAFETTEPRPSSFSPPPLSVQGDG